MHYYQFNIGNYRKDAYHLSPLEHGIYRMLIDSYYLNEGPLEADDAKLMRTHCIRTAEEQDAYRTVIEEFFELRDGVYVNSGCQKVIGKIYEKSVKARDAAEKRWANKRAASKGDVCSNNADAMRTHSECNADGMLPNTQYPTPNTIVNKRPPRKKLSEKTISEFIEECSEADADPIPITDPIFSYAEGISIPPDYLSLCWRSFVSKYSDGRKKYKDWRAVFRTAVKENWLKLWWIADDGSYQLTTAGKQAQKLQEAQR